MRNIAYYLDQRNDLDTEGYVDSNLFATGYIQTVRMPRILFRGCLEGALLGVAGASLYSVITGEFSAEAAQTGAILGASIGAVIDLTQYLMRWNRYDHKRFSL